MLRNKVITTTECFSCMNVGRLGFGCDMVGLGFGCDLATEKLNANSETNTTLPSEDVS